MENYQELVNALIYLVNQGEESGSIRYSGEEADFKKLMDEACLEVKQEDPLGNYAVDYIKYSVTSIVGSYEADVQITYRRTREQVASIVDATGAAAIRSELSRACLPSPVRSFCASATLRRMRITSISWCGRPISPIRPRPWTSPRPRWLCTGKRPAADRGSDPDLPPALQTLESRRNSLSREAERICQPLAESSSIRGKLDGITQALQSMGAYSAQGGSTAYDALLSGGGDSQGVALAFSLLCRQVGITCSVVDGQKDGQSHFWNVVQTAAATAM